MATAQPGSSSGKGQEADPGASVGGERLDWMVQHPKYTEMMALDVSDSTQVYAAFLVYLDLLEARNWKDVTCRGSAELQLVYLLGFPAEQEKVHVVVPMPVHMTLSHARFSQQSYWKLVTAVIAGG
ncbi:tRNA-splicing endonuclease subunit Sen15 isoform X2 [Callorhinchus milii]|uniref:tRNA splicing endonuclease subunit 15 n=1 Tax=Callorhinchus milii TaxID=7868 RepID=A0A4W3JLN4_CALMI|nr:tRNA-splicing endonuclease subunit Sen15 isoform X2 [Callorhinchus milii]|eukprot:gi/632956094/ref/XP_007893789.1/ PREDICTED: tRNA-splicing endonuclease subunit Sen15 isoform X2 [Callorhinchus milii]